MTDTSHQKNPLVSVIVPVFNEAPLLRRCIDSILKQTYEHIEVIIVDDGSTDGSSDLCDDLAQIDKRIVVIHQRNSGLSAARNAGIAHSHGEFVAFIDSDDYIIKSYIYAMVAAATKCDGIDLVITDFQTDNPRFSNPEPQKETIMPGLSALITAEQSPNKNAYIVAWDKLYSHRLFKYVQFPEGKIHEDEFTYYQFLIHSRKVSWINCPGYIYCFNRNGITGKEGSSFNLDTLEAFANKCLYYLKNESLQNAVAPLAISQFQWYFLLKVKQGWQPQNTTELFQYQSLCKNIYLHMGEILSVLSPLRKLLFIGMKVAPKLTSALYFWMKNIARHMLRRRSIYTYKLKHN